MSGFSHHLLRQLFYMDDKGVFYYKIPPSELFNSDEQWRRWCTENVGKPVPMCNGSINAWGRRMGHYKAMRLYNFTEAEPLRDWFARCLQNEKIPYDDYRLDSFVNAILTSDPSQIRQTAIDWALAHRESETTANNLGTTVVMKCPSFLLPWTGRRAGKSTDKYRLGELREVGDSVTIPNRDLPATGQQAIYSAAAARGITVTTRKQDDGSLVVTRVEPGTTKPGRPSVYPWSDLQKPGDSFTVTYKDLPATGIASIRSGCTSRGIRCDITKEGDGYRVTLRERTR